MSRDDDPADREEMVQRLRSITSSVTAQLPPHVGCLIVTFDYGKHGSIAYASTGERADCIRMLRELLANLTSN